MRVFLSFSALAVLLVLPLPLRAGDAFELADGDRVVLLGNTLIERAQRYGYWETAMTALHPQKNIAFRNLGWSGDTVWGEARARFGGPTEGFRHLREHVLALKPTVVILGYGLNESFAGEAGLPHFQKGLDALLDMLTAAKARVVILSPLQQEDLGRPLPDPTENNKNIRLYSDILRKTAEKRGYPFIQFAEPSGKNPSARCTDNGIHLTAFGYWVTAGEIAAKLGSTPGTESTVLELDAKGAPGIVWKSPEKRLPLPPAPLTQPKLRIQGLAPGNYALHIDGKKTRTATAADWAKGVLLPAGPEVEQVEKLRATIVEKNQLYFHRWRPQNETYLFLFRKGEQGQNAKEIPQFDPFVEKLEQEIAKLRVPVVHKYELVADRGEK